jgi:HAD superfamily hydrolase (TIGR01509 family)
VRAYLFDFNGVLVDDEAVHFAAFRDVVAPLGVRLDEATYLARHFAFDDRTALRTMLEDAGIAAEASLVDRLIADKSTLYFRAIDGALRLFPGAFALVRACAERGPVAIVSGAARAEIDHALRIAGATSSISTIVAAEDVEACKPDPAGYRAALERLGASPAQAIVVEDSIGGVRAARAAGVTVVAVAHSERPDALLAAGAARVVETIDRLSVDVLDAMRGGA